jgi:hypothetical protein
MITIPFFEKALYELKEDEVTAENILQLADRIDVEINGGPISRPIMSVPHILADESSAYYHGYVLAEMSVHQTRKHFLTKVGTCMPPATSQTLLKWICPPQLGSYVMQC